MKVLREKSRKNRELVIENAARLLREHGLQGVSLADIMMAAGLTHGGFYRHFTSKEELTTQASARAAASMKAATRAALADSSDPAFQALVKTYVSRAHRDNPGTGCILPTLATDTARNDNPDLRAVFAAVVQDYLDQLAKLASAMPDAPFPRHPGAVLAEMVGAIILSRVVPDNMANVLLAAVVGDLVGTPMVADE